MNHPRLTDSQLRDLQPGDRVSRYTRPGEVQTAPVARITATQLVVTWPDATEARYWRESGQRTSCRGEVLRMPAEEPDPRDADPVLAVLAEIATTATEGPEGLVVEDVAFLEAAESDDPRLDDEAREWLRGQGHMFHSLPLAAAQRSWWERERIDVEPSAPALPVDLLTLSTPCPVFYAALGPLLASSEARKEGVEIWHRPGKTWVVALVDGLPVGCGAVFLPEGDQAELASAYVLPEYRHQGVYRRLLLARTELANAAGKTRIVATCTPASAAILGQLGFVAIGESAGYTTMSLAAR